MGEGLRVDRAYMWFDFDFLPFLPPSLFAQTVVHVQHAISHSIMSRTTRLCKTLTAALYNECSTMTIETQVIHEIQNTSDTSNNLLS